MARGRGIPTREPIANDGAVRTGILRMKMAAPHVDPEGCFIGLSREFCFIPTWMTSSKTGYYMLYANELKRTMLAHRLVMMLIVGSLPNDGMVLHRCGNPGCYNPYHLYVGGVEENQRDRELHRQARATAGPPPAAASKGGAVFMPRPVALSTEASWLTAEFRGVGPGQCLHSDWLTPTVDGFQQLTRTKWPGEVAGAHRKVYSLFVGPLDQYDIISHSCGDCLCLNPYHLFCAGQQQCKDTFDFKYDLRRTVPPEARAEIVSSPLSNRAFAKKYGLHEMTARSLRADMRRI